MKIAVQDANVLIDLELAGLFDLWFQTGIETHTTDFIRAEFISAWKQFAGPEAKIPGEAANSSQLF